MIVNLKRTPLVLNGGGKNDKVDIGIAPGVVGVEVKKEDVEMSVQMDPAEAVSFAVAIIQLAGQANALAQQKRVQIAKGAL